MRLTFYVVSDAIKTVGDKCHISVRLVYPLSHYGLFLPPSENTGGVWLHNEDPINYYHIETKVALLLFSPLRSSSSPRHLLPSSFALREHWRCGSTMETHQLSYRIKCRCLPSSPPLTPHPSPLTPHPSPLTPHLSPLTSTSSPFSPSSLSPL